MEVMEDIYKTIIGGYLKGEKWCLMFSGGILEEMFPDNLHILHSSIFQKYFFWNRIPGEERKTLNRRLGDFHEVSFIVD